MSRESRLTSGVRIEPRLVPCLHRGHAMNRDDRFGGRSGNRATPDTLTPESEVKMTRPVNVAFGAVTHHFDYDFLEPSVSASGDSTSASCR